MSILVWILETLAKVALALLAAFFLLGILFQYRWAFPGAMLAVLGGYIASWGLPAVGLLAVIVGVILAIGGHIFGDLESY